MARVLVIGGGLAGMATAALLAADDHDVTVLERDASPLPTDAEPAWASWERRGVGQFRQAYAVQPELTRLLDRELPDVTARLEKMGGLRMSWAEQLHPDLPGRDELMRLDDQWLLTARRPVMEAAFATTAEDQPGVTVRRGVGVRAFSAGPSVIAGVVHVTGVTTEDGEGLSADLVIDATGRNSRIGERIADIGGRAPVESRQDNTTIYHTRFYRSRTGERPQFGGHPNFIGGRSIGLLALPSDNDTWCLSFLGMAEDRVLRGLRNVDAFTALARRFPDREEWLDGEPLTDVLPCVSAGDLTREFVVDGVPVATGVLAVGDTRAFTEPRQGRGTLFAVMQAVLLRDTLRHCPPCDPGPLAVAWEETFRREVLPWLRATNATGRGFARENRTYMAGEVPQADGSRGMALNRAFEQAASRDAQVARWWLDLAGCSTLPSDLLSRPGVVERVMELGADFPEPAGPTRSELLDLLSGN